MRIPFRRSSLRPPFEVSAEWSKETEAAYFRSIGSEGLAHSVTKPFSDDTCGRLLFEMGAVMTVLPPSPARILDIGCGTGWTSAFLAQRGYEVVGIDLSPEAIATAQQAFQYPNLTFVQHDVEIRLPYDDPAFDAALFFDSLHHVSDIRLPIQAVFPCLRPGGQVVICEPGTGHRHSETAQTAMATWGVNEGEAPPSVVVEMARAVGFSRYRILAHPHELHRHLYLPRDTSTLRGRLLASALGETIRVLWATTLRKRDWGLVILTK